MSTDKLKHLLSECVKEIDEWDLVHGCDPDSAGDLIKLLIEASFAVDMDPNKLQSLQDFLKDGEYHIVKR